MGRRAPVTLEPWWVAMSRVSGRRVSRTWAGSSRPSGPTGSQVTCTPCRSRAARGRRRALCSAVVVTT